MEEFHLSSLDDNDEYEQLWDGAVFTLDVGEDLSLSCCDCGSTHRLSFKVLKSGRIKITMHKDDVENKRLRKENNYEFKNRYYRSKTCRPPRNTERTTGCPKVTNERDDTDASIRK